MWRCREIENAQNMSWIDKISVSKKIQGLGQFEIMSWLIHVVLRHFLQLDWCWNQWQKWFLWISIAWLLWCRICVVFTCEWEISYMLSACENFSDLWVLLWVRWVWLRTWGHSYVCICYLLKRVSKLLIFCER